MKIVGKVNRDKHIFGDLSIGATFVYLCDVGFEGPYIYMVLEDVTNAETGELHNAVEIGSGVFAYFEDDHPIKRVKVEAHIVS